MRLRLVHVFILTVLLSPAATASSGREGAFLLERTGVKTLGMGGGVSTPGEGINALYTNPAALAPISRYIGYIELGNTPTADLRSAAAIAVPIQRRATFAAGIRGFRSDPGPAGTLRLTNDYSFRSGPAGFEENDLIGELAVGRFVRPDLSIGASVQWLHYRAEAPSVIREKFDGLYSTLGITYSSARRGITVGATLRNLGGRISGLPNPDIPIEGTVGVSYGRLRGTAEYINFAVEGVYIESLGPSFRLGAEYWWANLLAVRAGYDGVRKELTGNPHEHSYSTGLSVNFRGIFYDVAMLFPSNFSELTLSAGVTYSFGERRRRH